MALFGGVPPYILIIMGLIPTIIAIYYEKYFTRFWAAFWNIYGFILILIGLLFSAEDWGQFISVGLGLTGLIALVTFFILKGKANYIRYLGASGVILVFTVLAIGFFYFPESAYAVLGIAGIIFLFFIIYRAYNIGVFNKLLRRKN